MEYLNTAPLAWGFTDGPLAGKYELSFTVPSQCAEALRAGAADIAIIPAIEYQRIDDLVILPDMAIASKNRVRSLLLVSKVPIQQARHIALDRSSRSTQALTKILCHYKWKTAPEFLQMSPDLASMLRRTEAALLIGDPALRLSLAIEDVSTVGEDGERICPARAAGMSGGSVRVYDIVEEWRKMTNLSAVLAVWAARRDVASAETIEDFLFSRDQGRRHLADISTQAAGRLALPADQLQRYLADNIDFSLDEENFQGLIHYFALAAKMGLIPGIRTVEVAAARNKPVRYHDFALAQQT